jgi:hypothetical protein
LWNSLRRKRIRCWQSPSDSCRRPALRRKAFCKMAGLCPRQYESNQTKKKTRQESRGHRLAHVSTNIGTNDVAPGKVLSQDEESPGRQGRSHGNGTVPCVGCVSKDRPPEVLLPRDRYRWRARHRLPTRQGHAGSHRIGVVRGQQLLAHDVQRHCRVAAFKDPSMSPAGRSLPPAGR